jgi:hypothetical protein
MRRRPTSIAILLAGMALAPVSIWLARGFAEDREFGMSRLLFAWHDGRIAHFHRLFAEIEVGMDRGSLFAAMARIYPDGGTRLKPKIQTDSKDEIVLFMSPESAREPNCEAIILSLAHDRISRKRYSID